jgi:hypothetical protein
MATPQQHSCRSIMPEYLGESGTEGNIANYPLLSKLAKLKGTDDSVLP